MHRILRRSLSASAPSLPPCSHKPTPYTGPSKAETLALRKKFLNPGLFLFYKNPVMVVEGNMQYVWDETGRRFLDFFAGIVTVSVGHNHPKVTKAAVEQMNRIGHTTNIYLNNQIAEYAQELQQRLPPHLTNIYFVNSGSEATDLALLMSRLHTGNWDVIGLRNGYHGMSLGAMGVTNLSTWKYPTPTGFGIHCALNPDTYQGTFRDDPDAAAKYARDVHDTIRYETPGKVAAYIAETIQGVGGLQVMPEGYLSRVYEHVRAAGGLCIADEVQGGFGRTGTHYWSFQNQGVNPDIVTMAKGIGNGAPLAAVATTEEIAQTVGKKLHFNTYGGNPVCSAIGRAVLRAIDEDGLQANCDKLGKKLLTGFETLKKKHSLIGDVRGRGLMVGVELVKDRNLRTPATEETALVFEKTKDMGLLVGKGGLNGNIFRLQPPMCVSEADVDFVLDTFDRALSSL